MHTNRNLDGKNFKNVLSSKELHAEELAAEEDELGVEEDLEEEVKQIEVSNSSETKPQVIPRDSSDTLAVQDTTYKVSSDTMAQKTDRESGQLAFDIEETKAAEDRNKLEESKGSVVSDHPREPSLNLGDLGTQEHIADYESERKSTTGPEAAPESEKKELIDTVATEIVAASDNFAHINEDDDE